MSLISALNSTFAGLKDTEARLGVTAQNVTNADRAGYTKKVYESEYSTTDIASLPSGGQINSAAVNPYLAKSVIEDTSSAAKNIAISEYLSTYATDLGRINSSSTLSASLDNLIGALDSLSMTPEDFSLKTGVVNAAQQLAVQLSNLSESVQDLRTRADQEIGSSIEAINTSLNNLENLNVEITLAASTGLSVAGLEDERRVELENLAQYIDVDYFVDNNNQLKVYNGGRPLLDSLAHELEYTAASNVGASTLYPGGFSAIDLNGTDITLNIDGGKLGGLLELRDTTLTEEQEKLDEFAEVLMEQLNSLLNQGASVTSRSEIIGDQRGLVGTDPLGGTGSARIALTNGTGVVQNVIDFDLSTYATIDDFVTDINASFAGDITAAIDASGRLTLTSNVADQGMSFNELDSDIGGEGFSTYFGLNNLFDGSSADDISISDYLLEGSSYLSTGRLSSDVALAAGDVGVSVGDGSLSVEMNDAFSATQNFAAAGNFSSQSTSLDAYANKIIANIAIRADDASEEAATTSLLLDQTKTALSNLTGVNVDEEMANLIDLESKYAASATMMATIQQLFDELINAVR
tara:strand:+ start:3112 stop:4848 length:1737 start_codon:yes stop_codon:yes gene_type:complete